MSSIEFLASDTQLNHGAAGWLDQESMFVPSLVKSDFSDVGLRKQYWELVAGIGEHEVYYPVLVRADVVHAGVMRYDVTDEVMAL
jgi:hypothetical protein